MTETQPTCATCRFAEPLVNRSAICRRAPPTVQAERTVWSTVDVKTDWCGEWAAKVEAKPAVPVSHRRPLFANDISKLLAAVFLDGSSPSHEHCDRAAIAIVMSQYEPRA